MKVDLHCHSTNSDGTWEVRRILEVAEKKGIKVLCISDHDNLGGTQEAFEVNQVYKLFSGILLPGIEISTRVAGQKAHLLAYFPNLEKAQTSELTTVLEKIKNSRIERMKKMIARANELGMEVSFEEVLAEASKGVGADEQPTDIISRPHLARVLYKKGYVESREAAFDKYLADGKPLAIERFTLKFDEWINLVHQIGGLIVWAHPLHARKNFEALVEICDVLVNAGIDGIEFFYDYSQKYNLEERFETKGNEFLKKIIKQHNLLRTAGGDFHGDVGRLGMDIPTEDFDRFVSKLEIQQRS